jgi:DNA repair protein RadA/Sms
MRAGKTEIVHVCQNCGFRSAKWLGRCPDCNEWQTMVEERTAPRSGKAHHNKVEYEAPIPLSQAPTSIGNRLSTTVAELDRVLGGGLVPGSLVLIGGEPGIGKSTLLLHLLAGVAKDNRQVLYVSGEESGQQIRLRAERLQAMTEHLLLATESRVETVIAMALAIRPALLAVDSVQTMTTDDFPSAPGSVTQVRESTARLMAMAKSSNIPVVLVGHVTKDGTIAGPKVLEHMVDTVLYFEGDRGHAFRILRTVKNRFGSTNEIGVFEMKEEGLVEVSNPSELFLAERPVNAAGSVVLPSMEGTRPILVEVQALVSPSNLGTPRRTAIGADPQRVALLTAVLEKKAGLSLFGHDIFINIAGGIRVDEPALDLGIICAIGSSLLERPIGNTTAVCGEVGLAGEVRAVGQCDQRLKEAARLGFSRLVLPRANMERLAKGKQRLAGNLIGVATVQEALEIVLEK